MGYIQLLPKVINRSPLALCPHAQWGWLTSRKGSTALYILFGIDG